MQRADYDAKTIAACVQHVFASQEGQLVLDWLEDLYVRYSARGLIASKTPHIAAVLAYKDGQADVVINLRDVFERGITEDGEEPTETYDEEGD